MLSNPLNRSSVVVAGSVNLDHRLVVEALPTQGETVLAEEYSAALGGKGANQAAACSLTGVRTVFVANVGEGVDSGALEAKLQAFPMVLRLSQSAHPPGQAWVQIDNAGRNQITVLAGANAFLTADAVTEALKQEVDARFLVLQGEVPAQTICGAIEGAVNRGIKVILNLAPPIDIPRATLADVYSLILNEHEAEALAGTALDFSDDAAMMELCTAFGVSQLIVTLGERGALAVEAGSIHRVAAPTSPRIVDTVGAGDAFVGVYAAGLASGRASQVALEVAVLAASDSTQRPGAADSYRKISL